MTIIFLLFCIISLYGVRLCSNNDNYLSREQTKQVNGFFVFLIFMSHFVPYVDISGPMNDLYLNVRTFLRQLVVVSFLFYSGYGMFESFKRKGESYIKTIPTRFLKLLLRFDISVFLFLVLAIFVGTPLTLKRILLSFVAWEGLGNSYWYVFIILSLYIIMYITFKLCKCKMPYAVIAFTVGSVLLIVLLRYVGKQGAWYNTLLCFTTGVWYSYFKEIIDKIVNRSLLIYFVSIVFLFSLFMYFHERMDRRLMAYMLMGIFFCLFITLLLKKIRINNPILSWLGEHIFSIYILQRIPMILGDKLGLSQNVFVFFFICLFMTMIIAYCFDKYVNVLEKRIFNNLKKIA